VHLVEQVTLWIGRIRGSFGHNFVRNPTLVGPCYGKYTPTLTPAYPLFCFNKKQALTLI
jgi:hypothetical protein